MSLTNLSTLLLIVLILPFCQTVIDVITMENADQIFVTYVNQISRLLNTSYLQIFNGSHRSSYQGIIQGQTAFAAMPVRLDHKECPLQINVIFKIDTGAPISTLTAEVIERLFENCPQIYRPYSDPYTVNIAGRQFEVSKSQSYYGNLNILGANFMRKVNGRLIVDYSQYLKPKLQLQFDVNIPKDIEGEEF